MNTLECSNLICCLKENSHVFDDEFKLLLLFDRQDTVQYITYRNGSIHHYLQVLIFRLNMMIFFQ